MNRSCTPVKTVVAFVLLALVSACAHAPAPQGINDPYETQNRAVHDFNRSLDKSLVRPAANGYGTILPEDLRNSIGNFAANLDIPAAIVNDVLQANMDDAFHNLARFVFNTTLGVGGLFDPATAAGLEERDTDFGETLYVWGAGEGYYMELPVLGPATQRHAVGRVVGLFTNPISYLLPSPERFIGTGAGVASRIGDRYRFGSTIDSILYESADSYAQTRLLYLENRRFKLGATSDEGYFDPYEDPYAQ